VSEQDEQGRLVTPTEPGGLAAVEERCNCGYGGFHEPLNPRCDLNEVCPCSDPGETHTTDRHAAPAQTPEAVQAELADVLGAHARFGPGCACGWFSDDTQASLAADHATHVAGVLAGDGWRRG
jgi:hypothetical protein